MWPYRRPADASTAPGTAADQWSATGCACQRWNLTETALPPLGTGQYVLVNKNSGQYLEIPRASTAAGTQADQWPDSVCGCQLWTFHAAAGGAWTLQNVNSGLDLDIANDANSGLVAGVGGSSATPGAGVIQWTNVDVNDQLWQIVRIN